MQPRLGLLLRQFHRLVDLPVWLAIGCLRLLASLPLALTYCLACALGETCFWLYTGRRRITLRNLQACFPQHPPAARQRLARQHFHYLVYAVLTTGLGWWASAARLQRLTRIVNAERLDTPLQQGQNVILLAPHFAALEYGGIYLSSQRALVSMYQRNKHPLLDTLIKQHRQRFGLIQHGNKQPIKNLVRQLRQGLPFYYLPDQDAGSKGVFAPFYGIPTATFTSLGRLAALADATVIPCCTRMLAWGSGFEIVLLAPLENYPRGDPLHDTTRMNQAIEALIEQAPAQYFWSHRRFKTRPDGGTFY